MRLEPVENRDVQGVHECRSLQKKVGAVGMSVKVTYRRIDIHSMYVSTDPC